MLWERFNKTPRQIFLASVCIHFSFSLYMNYVKGVGCMSEACCLWWKWLVYTHHHILYVTVLYHHCETTDVTQLHTALFGLMALGSLWERLNTVHISMCTKNVLFTLPQRLAVVQLLTVRVFCFKADMPIV